MMVVLEEPESVDFSEVCFSMEAQRDLVSMFTYRSLFIFPVLPHPEATT